MTSAKFGQEWLKNVAMHEEQKTVRQSDRFGFIYKISHTQICTYTKL